MNIDDIWYGNHPLSLLLTPLSWLYCGVVRVRQFAYRQGWLKRHRLAVPVIIVGNVTVGGTGKTPLVIWLAHFLQQQGYKPAIISRGYGGNLLKNEAELVTLESSTARVGDEPLLLAKHANCPVAVAPQRVLAAQKILQNFECNIIISDDGLQHYALYRDIEIAVIDDIRRYGNKLCLPAGPLREPLSRLEKIDFKVTRGATASHEFSMQYVSKELINLANPSISHEITYFHGQTVHAIAGIGHPEKFFNRLRDHSLKIKPHIFRDHHVYQAHELDFDDDYPIIMTEKDAVKCQSFATARHWYLPIEARLPREFGERLLHRLKTI